MLITSISFKCSIELAPYQHCHIEMVAQLEPGDIVSDVLKALKDRVAVELLEARDNYAQTVTGNHQGP